MKVFYDKDCDLSLIKGKNVTILGYGSQGHAHAQNLNDSGVRVTVGLRRGGASWAKAEKDGLRVAEIADAVKSADVVMVVVGGCAGWVTFTVGGCGVCACVLVVVVVDGGCGLLERKGVASASELCFRIDLRTRVSDRQKGRGSGMVFCRLQIHVRSLKCS